MSQTPLFLFLDRDGVINRRLPGAYVKRWDEFEFIDGTLAALAYLTKRFDRTFVVTNQQGIGKDLMSVADLSLIHERMTWKVLSAGGHIDGIYYCPHLAADGCNCRKPAPGLALQAREEYSEVDFSRSLMVGDSLADMQFGAHLGMVNILIETKQEEKEKLEQAEHNGELKIAQRFPGLKELAAFLAGGGVD